MVCLCLCVAAHINASVRYLSALNAPPDPIRTLVWRSVCCARQSASSTFGKAYSRIRNVRWQRLARYCIVPTSYKMWLRSRIIDFQHFIVKQTKSSVWLVRLVGATENNNLLYHLKLVLKNTRLRVPAYKFYVIFQKRQIANRRKCPYIFSGFKSFVLNL